MGKAEKKARNALGACILLSVEPIDNFPKFKAQLFPSPTDMHLKLSKAILLSRGKMSNPLEVRGSVQKSGSKTNCH